MKSSSSKIAFLLAVLIFAGVLLDVHNRNGWPPTVIGGIMVCLWVAERVTSSFRGSPVSPIDDGAFCDDRDAPAIKPPGNPGRPSMDHLMNRGLCWMVYSYFGASVAFWCLLHRLIHNPPGDLWCGNVVTDPLLFLVNWMAPMVAVFMTIFVLGRIEAGRRPLLPLVVLPLFFGTTATLLYETWWLAGDFGFPLHRTIWWFPWL